MKKSILTLAAILLAGLSFAQGGGFNYKALITDNGNVLNTQPVTIKFTVLENGATSVYQETQSATTDANGIVAVNVGEGTVISGNFNTIDWGSNPFFLKVEIDTGSGYQNFGTTEFKAVPYAKYAEKAGNVFSGDFSDLSNVPSGLSDGDNVNDADHDATNELQTLTLSTTQLSISNGNNVNFTGWDTNASDDVQSIDDLTDAKNDGSSVFIGNGAGSNDDASSNYNVGVGKNALHNNTTGDLNTASGANSLYSNTTGSANTASGYNALDSNTTGNFNTANGKASLYSNTTGSANTANGEASLRRNTIGNYNTANGRNSLNFNTTGNSNTASGASSLYSNTTGNYNTALGYRAGFNNQTGSRNIFLGYRAGYNETGSDKLYIENSDSATPLIGGDFSTDEVVINGELGIGVATPDEDIHVKGGSGETILVESTGSSGSANIELATNGAMHDYFKMSKYGSAASGTFGTAPNQLSLANLSMLEVGTGAGAMAIRVVSNNPMYFITGNEVRMTLEADGDLDVKEKLTAPDSGDADMKAYIYGNITYDGNKRTAGCSDGFNISKTATGIYEITFASAGNTYAYTAIASIAYGNGLGFIRTYNVSATKLIIYTYDINGNYADKSFTFVMYKK